MKSPLPPTSASDADVILSPLVRISTISISAGICAANSARTIDACASASLLGRDPILILGLGISAIRSQRAARSLDIRVVVVTAVVVRVVERIVIVLRVELRAQQAPRDLGRKRSVERFVAALLQPRQNAMKQFVRQPARQQLDPLALDRLELRQPSPRPPPPLVPPPPPPLAG